MPAEMPWNVNISISTAVLVMTRISAFAIFAPFLGHAAVPPRVKAGFVLSVTVLLYPAWSRLPASSTTWFWSLIGEMLIGVTLGLFLNLVFEGVQVAGQIAGIQMGFSLANIIDPQSQVDTPVVSVFFQLLTLLIFLQMDVLHWLLRGLADSLLYLPPGRFTFSAVAVRSIFPVMGGIFVVGIQIAMPILVATIVTDLALGLISKASPHFPAMLFGVSVKAILGLFVLHAAIRYWPAFFEKHFGAAVAISKRLLLAVG